jgi:hypothetical protein
MASVITFDAAPGIGWRRWADVEGQIGCSSDGSCHCKLPQLELTTERVELVLVVREMEWKGSLLIRS